MFDSSKYAFKFHFIIYRKEDHVLDEDFIKVHEVSVFLAVFSLLFLNRVASVVDNG